MKRFAFLLIIVCCITSCVESKKFICIYFNIQNQTSYDLEFFKDYQYFATIKKGESYLWLSYDEEHDEEIIRNSLISQLCYKDNIASISLWKITDTGLVLAKKWRTEFNDAPGKQIVRFSDYSLTYIRNYTERVNSTQYITENFVITITDEDLE